MYQNHELSEFFVEKSVLLQQNSKIITLLDVSTHFLCFILKFSFQIFYPRAATDHFFYQKFSEANFFKMLVKIYFKICKFIFAKTNSK
jgi:hypothetical protein